MLPVSELRALLRLFPFSDLRLSNSASLSELSPPTRLPWSFRRRQRWTCYPSPLTNLSTLIIIIVIFMTSHPLATSTTQCSVPPPPQPSSYPPFPSSTTTCGVMSSPHHLPRTRTRRRSLIGTGHPATSEGLCKLSFFRPFFQTFYFCLDAYNTWAKCIFECLKNMRFAWFPC